MRVLYLGLRPKPGVFHCPVIRTEYCGNVEEPLFFWEEFTHVIFTSQTAVEYWPGPWDKQLIAIGSPTRKALESKGLICSMPLEPTQEGVMDLISQIDGYFFLPQSSLARKNLVEYMHARGIPHFAFVLYRTVLQKIEPLPNLDDFDEIVFTSPSTVEGFLLNFGSLPRGKKLKAIGPVTEQALRSASLFPGY